MELLAILIALAVYGLRGSGGALQGDGWFLAFRRWLAHWVGGSVLQLASILLPAALVAILYAWVDDVLFGVAALLVLVLVLIHSFGRGNLGALYASYLERWSRGDFQAAWCILDDETPREEGDVRQPAELHALARREYYARAFERNFPVLFWFVLLGPAGAVGYRLAAVDEAQPPDGADRIRLRFWMDWAPVRLLSICFALVGDFDACLYRWRALLDDTRTPAADALESCGNAALRIDGAAPAGETGEQLIARGAAELDAIEVMHRRAMLVWLVVIALLAMIR